MHVLHVNSDTVSSDCHFFLRLHVRKRGDEGFPQYPDFPPPSTDAPAAQKTDDDLREWSGRLDEQYSVFSLMSMADEKAQAGLQGLPRRAGLSRPLALDSIVTMRSQAEASSYSASAAHSPKAMRLSYDDVYDDAGAHDDEDSEAADNEATPHDIVMDGKA